MKRILITHLLTVIILCGCSTIVDTLVSPVNLFLPDTGELKPYEVKKIIEDEEKTMRDEALGNDPPKLWEQGIDGKLVEIKNVTWQKYWMVRYRQLSSHMQNSKSARSIYNYIRDRRKMLGLPSYGFD